MPTNMAAWACSTSVFPLPFRHPAHMSHKSRPDDGGFTCIHCHAQVRGVAWGTSHRNHCHACLWSRHVDDEPGDRANRCREPMEPIGIEVLPGGEWAVIHRCRGCKSCAPTASRATTTS